MWNLLNVNRKYVLRNQKAVVVLWTAPYISSQYESYQFQMLFLKPFETPLCHHSLLHKIVLSRKTSKIVQIFEIRSEIIVNLLLAELTSGLLFPGEMAANVLHGFIDEFMSWNSIKTFEQKNSWFNIILT